MNTSEQDAVLSSPGHLHDAFIRPPRLVAPSLACRRGFQRGSPSSLKRAPPSHVTACKNCAPPRANDNTTRPKPHGFKAASNVETAAPYSPERRRAALAFPCENRTSTNGPVEYDPQSGSLVQHPRSSAVHRLTQVARSGGMRIRHVRMRSRLGQRTAAPPRRSTSHAPEGHRITERTFRSAPPFVMASGIGTAYATSHAFRRVE
jgi:hypothetical protein